MNILSPPLHILKVSEEGEEREGGREREGGSEGGREVRRKGGREGRRKVRGPDRRVSTDAPSRLLIH